MKAWRSLLCLGLLLSACTNRPAPAEHSPTPVVQEAPAQATLTPFQPLPPTATALPSPTHKPTATPTVTPTSTPEPRISLLFTGVIVPARCVQSAIDARGSADYLLAEVKDTIQAADLAIGTFNATMSDYAPHTGCIQTYVLVGSPSNADALAEAGFDAMSVATNHIKNCGVMDCGDRAFFDTLENLQRVGIDTVGAGRDLAEALQPLVLTVKGVRFGIVSLGMVEPLAFAGEDSPGIASLDDDNLRSAIAAARQQADVVIAMPHWGPEDTSIPTEWQTHFAQVAVEAGADVVVGNHTHVVQAYQELQGRPVFYGLGNFIFDQTWDLGHQQGVILTLSFEGTRYTGYEFTPTHVDGDGTVHFAGEAEAAQILERIREASQQIP